MPEPKCDHTDLFDREFRAIRELIEVRFRAAELAARLAAESLNTRLEGQNQWRAQLDRERVNFVQNDRYETAHGAVIADIRRLEQREAKIDGAIDLLRLMGVGGLVGLLLSLAKVMGWL